MLHANSDSQVSTSIPCLYRCYAKPSKRWSRIPFSFLKILICLRVENKSKWFFYCIRIICYCNSAAMVLAPCRRRGLNISCILFVKTLHWLTKRFRYCKERLKERMIYLNIKREEKHFSSIQLLFLEELHAATQALFSFFFSFFSQSLFCFSQFNVEYMWKLYHGETRRQFPVRFLSIPME